MRKIVLALATTLAVWATPTDVTTMLQEAQTAFSTQKTINYDRESRFLANLKQQQKLLKKALDEVKRLKQESITLNNTIDKNEKTLGKLEEKLHLRSGNLGELYGVVKQISGDMYGQLLNSATSAIKHDRLDFLKTLSKTNKLPNTQRLAKLWYTMLEELTLQGFVGKENLKVIEPDGKLTTQAVQLAGVFSAITKEGFVEYLESAQTYSVLGKQPSVVSVANDAFTAKTTQYDTIIDPTRGQLLSLTTEAPTVQERIEQGSTIGYLILILGALGLLYAGYKGVRLFIYAYAIKGKKTTSAVVRLEALYENKKGLSTQQIELALEERLSKEGTKINSGLALVKLLAAVAPLMGLLGTVTGMIATFSAITLFGTGDPKLMAGGISQALITTVEGLVVAIPLLFAFTFLNTKAKALTATLDEAALGLLSKHESKLNA